MSGYVMLSQVMSG